MDKLYSKLIAHFNLPIVKQIFTNANLPELRTIDLNMGQVNNPEGFDIFYPAMFIDWAERNEKNTEPLHLDLSFHILQLPSFGTENFADNIQEGLSYLRFLKAVKKALNIFKPNNASKPAYKGAAPGITPYFKYHILNYSCYLDDTTAEPELIEVELQGYNANFGIKERDEDLPTSIETFS